MKRGQTVRQDVHQPSDLERLYRSAYDDLMQQPEQEPGVPAMLRAGFFFVAIIVFGLALFWLFPPVSVAKAHEWYPPQCCSGHDCRAIKMEDVQVTPNGFFVEESGELIAFADGRIRKTPPEGRALYHRCSEGGKPEGKTICLYIPNWTN